jgi:copper transport protein
VVLVALTLPVAAQAHANLVRLRPSNGAVLASPPSAVRVLFDDPIRPGPGVEAVGNGGGSVLARPAYVPGGNPRELVVPLRRGLTRGGYSVRWSVISDDGHNERGVTAFAVGLGATAPRSTLSAGGVGRTRDVVFRLLLFAGVLSAGGAAIFQALVWRGPSVRELSLVILGGCVLAAFGAGGLAAHGTTATRFGFVEWILTGVAAVGTAFAALALRERRAAVGAGVAAVALLPLPTLAGHALDANQPWWSAPVDVLHLLGASVWVGGLVALAVAVPRAVRSLEPAARGRLLAAMATRFSTLALLSVAAIATTGLVRALGELSAVSQVWSTSYGKTLLVKSGLLACLVVLGARNRYRLVPRLREASGQNPLALRAFAGLRRSLAAELSLLAVLVGAVALLTELPPGRGARAAEPPARSSAARVAKLPPPGGVVLARQVGDLAVALSARRAGGAFSLVATVLGPNGFGLDGLPVRFSVPGGPSGAARTCGPGCYVGSLPVRTARSVDVAVSGRPVRFRLPATLPAREATSLVSHAARAFASLRSLVIDEQLASSPRNRIRTRFEIVAPDRLAYRIVGGQQAIVVGDRRWDRSPNGPWRASGQSPLRLPAAPWSRVRDARVLGAGVDRGHPVWLLSFLDPTIPAWFEIAVDRRTLRTLDAHMTAAAHFMHDRYSSFDAPLRIRPPVR